MIEEVVILQGAEKDMLEGFIRYEASGKEFDFHDAIDEKISQLEQFPYSGAMFWGDFRRALLDKFPYGIFYRVIGRRIFVTAVKDLRLDPKKILERLKP